MAGGAPLEHLGYLRTVTGPGGVQYVDGPDPLSLLSGCDEGLNGSLVRWKGSGGPIWGIDCCVEGPSEVVEGPKKFEFAKRCSRMGESMMRTIRADYMAGPCGEALSKETGRGKSEANKSCQWVEYYCLEEPQQPQ